METSELTSITAGLSAEWKTVLKCENVRPKLIAAIDQIRQRESKNIVPPPEDIMNAFRRPARPQDIRVVIIGQDPYIKHGEAHGFAFSLANKKITNSLLNISKAIEVSCAMKLQTGDLTHWADQGVFLLNRRLTTDLGKSLADGHETWSKFTTAIISWLDDNVKGIIYILLGKPAQEVANLISNGTVLKYSHPSPMGDNRIADKSKRFANCKHFATVNEILLKRDDKPIMWGKQLQITSVSSTVVIKTDSTDNTDNTNNTDRKDVINGTHMICGTVITTIVDEKKATVYRCDKCAVVVASLGIVNVRAVKEAADTKQKADNCVRDNTAVIVMFTDGSCPDNKKKGPAGWSFYIAGALTSTSANDNILRGGYLDDSTNNRAELTAVLRGMQYIIDNKLVSVSGKRDIVWVGDSMYCINSWDKWLASWDRAGIIDEKANPDLMREMLAVKKSLVDAGYTVRTQHVNSHCERPTNTASEEYFIWAGNDKVDVCSGGYARKTITTSQ